LAVEVTAAATPQPARRAMPQQPEKTLEYLQRNGCRRMVGSQVPAEDDDTT
jgi:hypothetical protein